MIVICLEESKEFQWSQEELWLDWMSGFMCRLACFSSGALQDFSLIFSPQINDFILLVPPNPNLEKFNNALNLSRIPEIFCSERSKKIILNYNKKLNSKLLIQPLVQYLRTSFSGLENVLQE